MASKPYDPTLKDLVEAAPRSWPDLFGRPTGPTEVIDADIGTVSGAADKVLRVRADPTYLLHLEFVAGHDVVKLPSKVNTHNALLEYRHGLRVRSGIVLLRPEADSPQLTGTYERGFPDEESYRIFRYHVLRVWQLPPQRLLHGGPALLALAPISAVTAADLPGIIEQMKQRLRGRQQEAKIWAAAYILAGLRYSPALAERLFEGVVSMKESSTYQAILKEGRIEGRIQGAIAEAKKLLRRLGDDAFGPPDARTAKTIERQNDLMYLEALLQYVRTADSWEGLLIWVLIKKSSTYQAILEEGRVEGENQGAITEVKKMLRRFGDEAFGPPDACTAAAIERLKDLPRLEDLFLRLRTANSWQELLGQPAPGRRDRWRRTS